MRLQLFCLCLLLLLLGGCYSTPVRHLASDAALIKPGQSTVQDMLKYLGEPTERKDIGLGMVEYIYTAERPNKYAQVPVVNYVMDNPAGHDTIVLRAENDRIIHCEFRTRSSVDQTWKEDYTWDEIE